MLTMQDTELGVQTIFMPVDMLKSVASLAAFTDSKGMPIFANVQLVFELGTVAAIATDKYTLGHVVYSLPDGPSETVQASLDAAACKLIAAYKPLSKYGKETLALEVSGDGVKIVLPNQTVSVAKLGGTFPFNQLDEMVRKFTAAPPAGPVGINSTRLTKVLSKLVAVDGCKIEAWNMEHGLTETGKPGPLRFTPQVRTDKQIFTVLVQPLAALK
jgi:hypothetical protein